MKSRRIPINHPFFFLFYSISLSLLTFAAPCQAAETRESITTLELNKQLPSRLRIKGDKRFQIATKSAIKRIRQSKTGTQLLEELARTKRSVTIRVGDQKLSGATIHPTGNGDSVVLWDPDYNLKNFPSFLSLYHELVHALHEARQERGPKKEEEERAIGLGKFADYALSENALRKELGLPLRRSMEREEFTSPNSGISYSPQTE